MLLVKPSFEFIEGTGIALIEKAGRTCYKSEDKITDTSATAFVEMLDKRGHHAMLEHSFASVKVICDRGVTHEIVRHRLFAYAQESTRYCNYSQDKFKGQVTFILPPWLTLAEGQYNMETIDGHGLENYTFLEALCTSENLYLELLGLGWTPQQARSVLPNSLKTEIVISGNFREWEHFFKLRTAEAAHPQMREVAEPICREFEKRYPAISWRS